MSDNNLRINLNDREINLIGTAHVSQESVDEVKRAIIEEKPGMICVELDEGRFKSITQKDSWEKLNLSKVFREGKGFLLIANLALSSFQRRLGNELGVKPGDEMKVAIQTALDLNIPHSLCDL
jgi:pheromone shutdown protein TraB